MDESILSEQVIDNVSDESTLWGQVINVVSGRIHLIGKTGYLYCFLTNPPYQNR